MSNKHEYLKDGVWYGKHPPARFIGTVRHGRKTWEKTEVRPPDVDYRGRPVGHRCCPCEACAAWEAICHPIPVDDGRLFPPDAA